MLVTAWLEEMGRVGIEPTTLGLKGPCSTAELPARGNLAESAAYLNRTLRTPNPEDEHEDEPVPGRLQIPLSRSRTNASARKSGN